MKMFCISDNIDTMMGLRLAGVEGVVVHTESEVRAQLDAALQNDEIGIVLMTEPLVSLCKETVFDLKLHRAKPLIIEIPDRHGNGGKSNISRYIREAIGINIAEQKPQQ